MASFTNNFYPNGYALRIDCVTNSQNVANNTSNVTVSVHLVSKGSSYTISSSVSKSGTLTINGTSYSFSCTVGLSGNQDKTLYTKTVDIPHNSDGTKTLSVSTTVNLAVTLSKKYYGNVTASGSTVLTTIPRTTPVTISGNGTFGNSKWIGHTRASTNFTVTLRYACGGATGTIVSKSATNETYWTPPKSLQSQIPKATSISIVVYCDTYNGNTLIGTTSTSFMCYLASDCVPVINGGTFTNAILGGTKYWQTVSQVRAEINCAGAYGSTINKYVLTVDGQSITNYGHIIWSGVLTGSGDKDISLTITDSRGKTATKTWTNAINITAYAKPTISTFTCKRTGYDENDTEVVSNLGTIGYFTATGSFHSNATDMTRKFMYKPTGTTTWVTIDLTNENQADYQFSKNLATGSAYNLKYVMSDAIATTEVSIVMQNIYPLINLSADGTGLAFGKECTISNRFAVEMDATFGKWCGINSLQVIGSALCDSNLTVKGNATFDTNLTVKGNIMCNTNLTVSNMLYSNKFTYATSGGWIDSAGSQTWGLGFEHHVVPMNDMRYLGSGSHRWQSVYLVVSPNVASDARMKENVKYMYNQPEALHEYTDMKENDEITTQDLLDFLKNDLYMVTFDYKQNTDGLEEGEAELVTSMNNRQIGFIAQDMADTKVGKYLVTKDNEGMLGYETSNWTSIIAGALQQEIRTREAEDKKLMEMLNAIINE